MIFFFGCSSGRNIIDYRSVFRNCLQEAGELSGRILAGFLAVLLMMVAGAAEPTRVVQAEEILRKIELEQPVEYDNVVVVGDLNLSGLNLSRVAAKQSNLEKSIGLPDYGIIVTSPISISNSLIKGTLNLNKTVFQDLTYFYGTRFEGPAFLIGSMFSHNANFMLAEFNQSANFLSAQFKEDVYFWGAKFNQPARFLNAQFNQTVSFFRARFNQTADFRSVQFEQEAYFDYTYLLDVFFDYSHFSKDVFFNNAQIAGNLSLYNTKYENLNIRWSSIHDLAYDDTAYHLLIQNFNKLGFGDDARECQYSYRCKHREELFRQHKFDRWPFDLLAWASYGYGLRPVRPLGWAALLILMGGLFFFFTGSVIRSNERASEKKPLALRRREQMPKDTVSVWEAILLSATYFTSGASSIISATPTEFVPVGRGRYVVVILRLLGWIFFVLFLSSLTRTV